MKPNNLAWIAAAAAALGLFFVAQPAAAATSKSGTIYANETWTAAGSPYVVSGNFIVAVGATLTIEPGVVVKLEASAQLTSSDGVISAVGTAANPIIFTSIKDDAAATSSVAAEDTNGDGTATTPAPGDWLRIVSSTSGDVYDYIELRYADHGLQVSAASPGITHSTFHHNNYAVRIAQSTSALIIEKNTIYQNGYGLYFNIAAGYAATVGANNNIYDNTTYGAYNITYATYTITANGNWWGDSDGPCRPVADDNVFGDCTGYGNKASSGFTITDFRPSAYSAGAPAASTGSGAISAAPPPPPKILKFEVVPAELIAGVTGGGAVISWDAWGTDRVEFGEQGALPELGGIVGSKQVAPAKTTTYALTAYGAGGQTSATLTVTVRARDPVIIVPGILGSWRNIRQAEFVLDPILHTYDGLWEGLRNAGYVEGGTLFAFPYDWRQDNVLSAKQLGLKIRDALEICKCKKVDVVAHSMGGLVTRYYVQNISADTIDQLIFIGTPQLGAPKAYLAWEAGKMGSAPQDRLLESYLKLEAAAHNFSSVVKYIHERVVSVRQLLPVFGYLVNYQTQEAYQYSQCKSGLFACNDLLDELNSVSPKDYNGISVYHIVNDALQTPREFLVAKTESGDSWEHGKPVNYPSAVGMKTGEGDGTVPANSAQWGAEQVIKISAAHKDLPYYSQKEIVKILTGKTLPALVGPKPGLRVLAIAIHSPVDITVTTPSGKVYGAGAGDDGWAYYSGTEDPEFITIPDPEDGDFTITVTGTGEGGKFGLEASLLADEREDALTYEGEIAPGQVSKFVLTNSGAENKVLEMEVLDLEPPQTVLLLDGEKVGENYAPVLIGVLSAKDDYGGEVDTAYSLDDGATWQKYAGELKFDVLGEHRVLYKSADKSGNNEQIRVARFTLVEKPIVPIAPVNPVLSATTTPTSTPLLSSLESSSTLPLVGREGEGVISEEEEVLGATTKSANERSLLKFASLLIILSGLAILSYLIIKRHPHPTLFRKRERD